MIELTPSFFAMLRLAEKLYESVLMDKVSDFFRTLTLNEDFYYELAYESTGVVFENTSLYYNEEKMVDTYVFCDPIIDRFCQLCRQYEQRRNLTEEENPYRKRIQAVIRFGFYLNGYDYNFDWKLSETDRGRRRLLFFYGGEFCGLDELPEGLLDIRDGFLELNLELETALTDLTEKNTTEKEAA